MIADIVVELVDTDRVMATASRPIIEGADSPRVTLMIGSLTMVLPRDLAGKVERGIATELTKLR